MGRRRSLAMPNAGVSLGEGLYRRGPGGRALQFLGPNDRLRCLRNYAVRNPILHTPKNELFVPTLSPGYK